MGKLRVHELAKDLGISSRVLIDKLKEGGLDVKTASSSVDAEAARRVLNTKSEEGATKRPRTIMRRRKRGDDAAVAAEVGPAEESLEAEAVEAEAVEAPVASEPEEAVVPAEAAPQAEAPVETVEAAPAETVPVEPEPVVAAPVTPAVVSTPAEPAETTPEAAPSEAPVAVEPTPVAAEAAPIAVDAKAEGGDEKPAEAAAEAKPDEEAKKPSNVRRMIDPKLIQRRLSAEGRTQDTFRPRRQREYKVNYSGAGGPRVTEVTARPGGAPGAPGAAPGAPGAAPGAPGSGPRPGGGGRKGGGRTDYQARRDARNERYFTPGRKQKSGKKGKATVITQAAAHKRVVEMSDMITIGELAHKMAVKAGQLIQVLMGMGMMATVNQSIDVDTTTLVASEFGFEVKNVAIDEAEILERVEDGDADLETRAPVITVMGHVDHGKTSLLDHIRKANVTKGEAGGITQHIGAYSVEHGGQRLTFLDTPGHAAFSDMRERGAQITDIVVLAVAADDGVMPQTKESIERAKEANVPIVIAINKCDKPDAKPERVMQELTEYGIVPEAWGGENITVEVSALKGTNMDKLLESILLQAEVLDLKANPKKRGVGSVIEAQLDKGRGAVATVLVQSGTLKAGDFIVAGEFSGKIRALYDSHGKKVKTAGPSMAVQVLGLSGVPAAGDPFDSVADDKTAKKVAEHRAEKNREIERSRSNQNRLMDFLNKKKDEADVKELNLIVKGDVRGSVEAVSQMLEQQTTKKVRVNLVHSGVGTITESDVNTAVASGAMIIGFNVKPDAKASALARHEQVDARFYRVVYDIVSDVLVEMANLLEPIEIEEELGVAEVRQVFSVPKLGLVAGSYVTDGKFLKSARVRVKRDGKVIHTGPVVSLRRFKDDVKEVAVSYECGIGIGGFKEVEEGDTIECYEIKQVRAELDEPLINLKEEKPAPEASAPA